VPENKRVFTAQFVRLVVPYDSWGGVFGSVTEIYSGKADCGSIWWGPSSVAEAIPQIYLRRRDAPISKRPSLEVSQRGKHESAQSLPPGGVPELARGGRVGRRLPLRVADNKRLHGFGCHRDPCCR